MPRSQVSSSTGGRDSSGGGEMDEYHDTRMMPLSTTPLVDEHHKKSNRLSRESSMNASLHTDDSAGNLNDDDDSLLQPYANNVNATAARIPPTMKTCQIPLVLPKIDAKKVILGCLGMVFLLIIWDAFFTAPEKRLLQPDFSDRFLRWVQLHPTKGLLAILIVIAVAVVSMVPIGTPLTLGCGFIYRGVYGWQMGLFVSTAIAMLGSTLGAVTCFLLGRYLMRDQVRKWVRNYPIFDAIDTAASENGMKIMAMLYLTPVLPLGLVSYMCGTTSMKLHAFTVAKIASLPLYLIYTFLGASAHAFIKKGAAENDTPSMVSASDQAKQLEENESLIIGGIVLSIVMMTLITRTIKRELMNVLDEQKKEKTTSDAPNKGPDDSDAIELGLTARRRQKVDTD
eukprot:CAMPEP_0119564364 /NCGR_PEP_ID=MMETSP1352-20130426/26736_1 /TAXON_ID=265584 /ORGANISM="Stauroneis constricta, Strain CCMP1120" /LENGTH=396 /DNA_ID=CAMNT_0007613117 /DNA_START=179 /DNA_END=1369 /DNA_ORIENTATION=-